MYRTREIVSQRQMSIVQDRRQRDEIASVRLDRKSTEAHMRGWGIGERRQSDVSACSRARRKNRNRYRTLKFHQVVLYRKGCSDCIIQERSPDCIVHGLRCKEERKSKRSSPMYLRGEWSLIKNVTLLVPLLHSQCPLAILHQHCCALWQKVHPRLLPQHCHCHYHHHFSYFKCYKHQGIFIY